MTRRRSGVRVAYRPPGPPTWPDAVKRPFGPISDSTAGLALPIVKSRDGFGGSGGCRALRSVLAVVLGASALLAIPASPLVSGAAAEAPLTPSATPASAAAAL